MKNVLSFFVLLGMIFGISGCGLDVKMGPDFDKIADSGSSKSDESYSFKIDRTCFGTGCGYDDNEKCNAIQSFSSHGAYCAGLKDEKLNARCARRERKQAYLAHCGQDFTDTNAGGIAIMTGGCRSSDKVREVTLTSTELCKEIANDERDQPCTVTYGFYDRYRQRYECN